MEGRLIATRYPSVSVCTHIIAFCTHSMCDQIPGFLTDFDLATSHPGVCVPVTYHIEYHTGLSTSIAYACNYAEGISISRPSVFLDLIHESIQDI